jgi:DNA repair ATPase RecN
MIPLIESNTSFIQSIAQSSREQHENILHVDRTIQKLNYMSQEHAVAAEELASGTEELEEQMHQLTQMVAYFKFDGQELQQTTNARNNQPSQEKKKVIKIWKKKKKFAS